MIGPPRVGQQSVDRSCAASFRVVIQEQVDFFFRRRDSNCVQCHATQEGEFIGQWSGFEVFDIKLRPHGAVVNPLLQQSDLFIG